MEFGSSRLRVALFIFSIAAASFIVNYLLVSGCSLSYLGIDMYAVNSTLTDESLPVLMVTVFQRLKQLVIVILIFKFISTDISLNLMTCFAGIMTGLLASIQTYYMGMAGVMYVILCFFPHFIFYIINIRMIAAYYDKKCGFVRLKTGDGIRYILINTIIFILGILSELLINRIFLKNFYQYVVLQ